MTPDTAFLFGCFVGGGPILIGYWLGCAMDDEFSREARVVLGARVVG